MTKHTHTVVAEMIDSFTGERKFPNEGFTPHDDDQADRLTKAGCIKEGAPAKAEATTEEKSVTEGNATAKPAPAASKPAAARRPAGAAKA